MALKTAPFQRNMFKPELPKTVLSQTALSKIVLAKTALLYIFCFQAGLLCFLAPSQAVLIRHLNDLQTLEAPISSTDLTRIAVEGDRISHVFGMKGAYILEADEGQGQIFIRPLRSGFAEEGTEQKPLHITLTTEGGKTQDLRLMPQDKNPEALILKPEETPPSSKERSSSHVSAHPVTRDEVEALLQAAREGRIPLDYKSAPLPLSTLQGPYLLVGDLRGSTLRCLTYEVKNTTTTPLNLSEEGFLRTKDVMRSAQASHPLAVFISKKTLNPGEGTLIYVVVSPSH